MADEIVVTEIKGLATAYLGSTIRHAITAIGAILVYKGITTEDVVTDLITPLTSLLMGIALYAVGQIWSVIQKQKVLVVTPTEAAVVEVQK